MKKDIKKKKRAYDYDEVYRSMLAQGRMQASNFVNNKKFLHKVKILEKDNCILEVGCGTGYFSNYLHEKGYTNIHSNEISTVALDYAKKHYPNLSFSIIENGKFIYPDKKFDVVLSFDVIEHIPDIKKHFLEVKRVLKDNGYYLFSTPNRVYETLFYFFRKPKDHPSTQSKRSLKILCNELGFKRISYVKIAPTLSKRQRDKITRRKFVKHFSKIIFFLHGKGFLNTNLYCILKK